VIFGILGIVVWTMVLFTALCPVRIRISGTWEDGKLNKNVDCVIFGRRLSRFTGQDRNGADETSLRRWWAFFGEEISQTALEKMEVTLALNTGDVCITAVASGIAWGAMMMAAAWLTRHFDARFLKPKLCVQPEFYGPAHVSAVFDCILTVPLDHIIFILQRLALYYIRKKIRRKVS
jgi:hypothetical protein